MELLEYIKAYHGIFLLNCNILNLLPGSYSLTVTDDNGCVKNSRDHIVITSKKIPTQEALSIVDSFSEACSVVQTLDSKKAFIIGGATLFTDTLHFCSLVHVSRIHIEPKADIFFTFPVDN